MNQHHNHRLAREVGPSDVVGRVVQQLLAWNTQPPPLPARRISPRTNRHGEAACPRLELHAVSVLYLSESGCQSHGTLVWRIKERQRRTHHGLMA